SFAPKPRLAEEAFVAALVLLMPGCAGIRIEHRVDEQLQSQTKSGVARAQRDCGCEVAARAVPANGDSLEAGGCPLSGCPRVLDSCRVGMLGREAIVDGQDGASGVPRQSPRDGV